jgi:hypothetical protein
MAAQWGYAGPIWPWVFYVNGILSVGCLYFFREEFNLFGNLKAKTHQSTSNDAEGEADTATTTIPTQNIWNDTLSIAKETLSSKSGRAILAAQVGQGALLYSIASWGPLYLERVNAVPFDVQQSASNIMSVTASSQSESASVSPVAVAASAAALSLIFPQITQALVGISIGASADQLSSKIGTRITRRALQIISGVVPAIILWYLSQLGSGNESGASSDLLSPAFLFGTAQTISALSLGAVSVSHLDIATPSDAGAVYALGNVAAAASGSLTVNLFGRLLESDRSTCAGSGAEFGLPFRVVAVLSAVGALIYGCTVETELEIGFNETATDNAAL